MVRHLDLIYSESGDSARHHIRSWYGCTKCHIGHIAHNHVFWRGKIPCQILFVGEAPGKTEDLTGQPFVGRSGKILDGWISDAMEQEPFTYAITNTVLCRPTDRPGGPNRPPTNEELRNCNPRLQSLIKLAGASGVVLLGRFAQKQVQFKDGTPVLWLPHPAYVLRCGGKSSHHYTDAVQSIRSFSRKVVALCR